MRQIDWYLDTARERLGATSDNDLARKTGISREAISQWRTRRSWPTAARMVKLAGICGVDPHLALADLGTWREPEVTEWRDLVARLTSIAPAVIVALAVFFGDGDGGAQAAQSANITPPGHSAIYIMRQKLVRWLRRVTAKLLGNLPMRHSAPELSFA